MHVKAQGGGEGVLERWAIFWKSHGAWSANLKNGWRVKRWNFPFLVGALKFSKTCRSISKIEEEKKKAKNGIRVCVEREIYVEMVECGAKKWEMSGVNYLGILDCCVFSSQATGIKIVDLTSFKNRSG